MPSFFVLIGLAILLLAQPVRASEPWQEYLYPEAGFSAYFPATPTLVERIYRNSQSPDGAVMERIYSFNEGGVIYSVGIIDFTHTEADPDIAVGEIADALMDKGKLMLESSIYIDQMHGREMVVIAGDDTRYTDGIFFIKKLLYEIKVVYPASNSDPAGSSGISLFQVKFHFLDPY